MSGTRRVILIIAGLLIAVTGMFPPWTGIYPARGFQIEWQYGRAPLFDAPSKAAVAQKGPGEVREAGTKLGSRAISVIKVQIDHSRLIVEWVVVMALAGVALLLTGNRDGMFRRQAASTNEHSNHHSPEEGADP